MHYLLIGMEIAAKARAGIRPQGLPMLAASGYLNDSMRQAGGGPEMLPAAYVTRQYLHVGRGFT